MAGDSRSRLINRVAKLFTLGDSTRNTSEAETLAAITRAKHLMMEHNITLAEVETAKGAATAQRIRIVVGEANAYTLFQKFAAYDDYIGHAVDRICGTKHYIKHKRDVTSGRMTWSRVFVGEETDAAVAGELFMLLLTTMRRSARQEFGGGWGANQRAYCLGYSARVWERAGRALAGPDLAQLTGTQEASVALVIRSKTEAVAEYMGNLRLGTAKKRRQTRVRGDAYALGRQRGESVNLGVVNRLREGGR